MRKAAQERVHEMVTVAAVELREEERVSLRAAFVLFPFLARLCSICCTPLFLIYIELQFCHFACCVIAWRIPFFFLPLSCILRKRNMLLYLILGPLSF